MHENIVSIVLDMQILMSSLLREDISLKHLVALRNLKFI
jgi:hypothetical protein